MFEISDSEITSNSPTTVSRASSPRLEPPSREGRSPRSAEKIATGLRELLAENSTLEETVHTLQARIATLQQERQAIFQSLADIGKERDGYRGLLDEQLNLVENLGPRLTQTLSYLEQSEQQRQQLATRLQEVERENASLVAQLTPLRSSLQESQSRLESLQNEHTTLIRKNEEITNQLQAESKNLAGVRQQNQQLRLELASKASELRLETQQSQGRLSTLERTVAEHNLDTRRRLTGKTPGYKYLLAGLGAVAGLGGLAVGIGFFIASPFSSMVVTNSLASLLTLFGGALLSASVYKTKCYFEHDRSQDTGVLTHNLGAIPLPPLDPNYSVSHHAPDNRAALARDARESSESPELSAYAYRLQN